MKKLLILGNGFDLQAKLKSSFVSFFSIYEKPVIEKWIANPGNCDVNNVSLISLLLYNTYFRTMVHFYNALAGKQIHSDFNKTYKEILGIDHDIDDWMNVESFIYKLFGKKAILLFLHCFDNAFEGKGFVNGCFCEMDSVDIFMRQAKQNKRYFHIHNYYDFLLEELHLFEKRFASFLKNELGNTKEYYDNATKILRVLLASDNSDDISILNFNYTNVFNCLPRYLNVDVCTNVHATIGTGPIIGIDDTNIYDINQARFTKTFRKLVQDEKPSILHNKYDEIIIYGHSLGKQDYAYFQSIFDYIDLYNGKTKIIFIYSDNFIKSNPGDDIDALKQNHKMKMAQSLFSLIREYGKTLNNINHGKNLLHKLILEGRVTLKLFNFIND